MVLKDTKCLKCGHSWRKRADDPLKCPKCQSYKYKQPKKREPLTQDARIKIPEGQDHGGQTYNALEKDREMNKKLRKVIKLD